MERKNGSDISRTSTPSSPEQKTSDLIYAPFGYFVRTEERCCQDCGNKFMASVGHLMLANTPERELGGRYCPGCQAKRISIEEQEEKQVALIASGATRHRWRKTCGIPFHFIDKDFDTFEKARQVSAYNLSVKYADKFPVDKSTVGYPSLLMYSKIFGVGKTHLATSIGHRILGRSTCLEGTNPIMFITETDIMLRIRATYNRDYVGDSEQAIYGSLKGKALLILDDVGKEQPQDSKFMQRVYFHVIDGRYQRRLPMVITSNLDMEEIFDHVGGASADRIFEMTQGNIVELKGKSYRRRVVKEGENDTLLSG